MDGRKTIRVKVTKDKEQWSAIKQGAKYAFMGMSEGGKLVQANECGVYMIMN